MPVMSPSPQRRRRSRTLWYVVSLLIDPARALAERMLRELPAATEGLLQRWLGGREALLRA